MADGKSDRNKLAEIGPYEMLRNARVEEIKKSKEYQELFGCRSNEEISTLKPTKKRNFEPKVFVKKINHLLKT